MSLALAERPDAQSPRRPGRPTLSDDALLDIALDLFLKNGFERTSIDAITIAAGMAKRTVYARYGDKLTLFKAALTRAIENWIVPVERLRAAECAALEETLQKIGALLLANVLSPAGLRLLQLSNTVSVSMPEIAAYNTRIGTEPTLIYLADLFRRRLLPETATKQELDEAALAFLHLVVGGPASMAGWGVQSGSDTIVNHTRYCVRLFLYGTLGGRNGDQAEQENHRLNAIIDDALVELDRARSVLSGRKRKNADV